MPAVKDKIRICQSRISDFDVEYVNGSPFYNRYVEFLRVFKKHIHIIDPELLFAQPEENSTKGTVDWYIPTSMQSAISLDKLKSNDLEQYNNLSSKRTAIIQQLKTIEGQISNGQEKAYFICALKFLENEYAEKVTYCSGDNIAFAVWGMNMRKGRVFETVITEDVKEHRVHNISFSVLGKGEICGSSSILRKHGHILQGSKDIPEIKADKHFAFIEWIPFAPHGKTVESDMAFTAVCKRVDDFQIDFIASEGGSLTGSATVDKKPDEVLLTSEIPTPVPNEGYRFERWEPEIVTGIPMTEDLVYTALFSKIYEKKPSPPPVVEPEMCEVRFEVGDYGQLNGASCVTVPYGSALSKSQIPDIIAKDGYTFQGWDKSTDNPILQDTMFMAQYAKIPWYRRWWLWLMGLFTGKGCLKWLLWLLVAILLLWLLSLFFKSCVGCSGFHSTNGVAVLDSIARQDGSYYDDNGHVRPITGNDGRLPDGNNVVAPVMGEDGDYPPIVQQPGVPNTIANRLFLFMEEDNGNVDALAQDFKKVYSGEQYSIIGFDREVKLLVIQVPEEEREQIRQTINSKIPNHKFIVFDEEIYELNGTINTSSENPGWHLDAIHLKNAWKTTKGSDNIIVAVIDDGIEAAHPMFKGRIVDAYNVFTRNNKLGLGEGHGTHTAGLAVGSENFFDKGASGVAPDCKLMPVQVFDNNKCPLSALIAGVMYAIHHDADVINLSVGPSFKGLNMLPVETQDQIAKTQFKNMEKLWSRVCRLAAKKNCILVFASGNDDILSSIPPENRNESAIVVTAVDKRLYPAVFTNYGPCSDISAPGKDILSSYPRGVLQSYDGTSMAAPIVAGTIALMKSLKKDLTVEEARNVLYKSGADVYGNIPPMVLVDAALDCVKRGDFSKPSERTVRPVPGTDDFDSSAGKIVEINIPASPEIINPAPQPANGDETDYEEIRRLIKIYEEKIEQLKKKLPENN